MTLGQLLKSVACEGDAAAAVMALVCANLACFDLLSQPWTRPRSFDAAILRSAHEL